MILLLEDAYRLDNIDVKKNLLTLGRNTTYKHHIENQYQVSYRASLYNTYSGVITLISGHSTGKTVLLKRLYSNISLCQPKRPGIIFDMQGQDHRASKKPSREGYIFTNIGEHRWGYENKLCNFTPAYLHGDNHYDDYEFTIPWTELTEDEWTYLLTQGSDAKSWIHQFKYIIRKNKSKIKSLKHLMREVERAARRKGNYDSDILPRMRELELYAMEAALRALVENNYLSEKDDPRNVDMIALLEAGYWPVLNFHLDTSPATKLYTGYWLRKIYQHYNKKYSLALGNGVVSASGIMKAVNAPIVIIEEANVLAPPKSLAQRIEAPGDKWVKLILTKGMKILFKLIQNLQDAREMDSSVRRNIYNDTVFVCNPTIEDMKALAQRYGREVVEIIRGLDREPDSTGAREWLCVHEGKFFTFRPAASMVEFLKR